MRDKDGYEIVPKIEERAEPRGWVCGECGRRFEAGKAYGLVCASNRCPMGFGPLMCNAISEARDG
jgi:hypothetical protein